MQELQTGLVAAEGRAGERGIALVAVMIALVAAAGIVASLYGLGGLAGRVTSGQERGQNVDAFAKGVANACSLLVDALLSVGDFSPPNTFNIGMLGMDAGFQVQYDPGAVLGLADLEAEVLLSTNDPASRWFSDFQGAAFVPDLRLVTGRMTAEVDVDLLSVRLPSGQGIEFGEAVQGQFKTVALNTYRCYVEARDPDTGRGAAAVTVIKKEIGT